MTLSPATQRLSVPPRVTRPPRPLTDAEAAALLRVADCLIPESGPNPKASDTTDYLPYLHLALAAFMLAMAVALAPFLAERFGLPPAVAAGRASRAWRCCATTRA